MPHPSRRNLELQQRWQQHLDRQQASGLPARQYCLKHQISQAGFYYWKRVLRQRQQEQLSSLTPGADQQTPACVPVTLADLHASPQHTPADRLEIELPGGVRLKVPGGFDEGTLRLVLELAGVASC